MFHVRAIRHFQIGDRRVMPGAVIELPAFDAARLVRLGLAVLLDGRDVHELAQVLGTSGRPSHL